VYLMYIRDGNEEVSHIYELKQASLGRSEHVGLTGRHRDRGMVAHRKFPELTVLRTKLHSDYKYMHSNTGSVLRKQMLFICGTFVKDGL
jgi:hypothetical protein